MLTNNKNLKGLVIRASDGEIGTVDELYFDDQSWAIRYLTVETGNWLDSRKVLISPRSILQADWTVNRIDVALTREQVEKAPNIDTQRPVSRQHEAEYFDYYRYPYYWSGPDLGGASYLSTGYPIGLLPVQTAESIEEERIRKESADSNLRSTGAVAGYHVEAQDGEIGHVRRFVIDDETWAIRYLEVATKNWWPGKHVLLSPGWVESVSWEESKVYVGVTQEAIRSCPEYTDTMPITREYENKLYFYYVRPPYWTA